MKKTKQQSSFMNMGTSLLLVIFLVLTLVTFAVLSLSSAKSDYNLSAKLAKHKTEYYDASAKAEAVLSEIDEKLETLAQESHNDTTSYYAAAGEQFDQVSLQDTLLHCEITPEDALISYTIPMSDSQALQVILHITDYTQNDTYYTIQTWQVISTDSWEGDQTIQLLPMEE